MSVNNTIGSVLGTVSNVADTVSKMFDTVASAAELSNKYVRHQNKKICIKLEIQELGFESQFLEETAMENAERRITIQKYCEDPKKGALFSNAYDALVSALEEKRKEK